MPRTPSVTEEEVFAAADAVVARGLEPTVARVRAELDNRGGGAQVAAMVKTWREKQTSKKTVSQLGELSGDTLSLIHSLRQTLHAEIDAEYNARRARADAEIEAAQTKLKTAEEERDRAVRDAQLSEKTIKTLSGNLKDAHKESADWQARYRAAEAKSVEVIERLKQETRDQKALSETRAQESARQMAAMEQENHSLKKKIDALGAESKKSVKATATQIDSLREKLTVTESKLASALETKQTTADQLAEEKQRAGKLATDIEKLQKQLDKLQESREIESGLLAKTQQELIQERDIGAVAARELKHVRAELGTANRTIRRLQDNEKWLREQFSAVQTSIESLRGSEDKASVGKSSVRSVIKSK